MRYIKLYKTFESIPVDPDDIRDICLDITDNSRFKATVNTQDIKGVTKHYVLIYLSDVRDYDGFTLSEVKDVVIRIKDFLGNHYGGCSPLMVGDVDRINIDIEDDVSIINKYREETDKIANLVVWIV